MEKPVIDYIRVSITDKCNLRCRYCNPLTPHEFIAHDAVLRYEELGVLLSVMHACGIRKIKITGGEPLIKRDIDQCVRLIKELSLFEDISLTTNGVLLAEKSESLKRAGLSRVNISLDTLKRERFHSITGRDDCMRVMHGIAAAQDAGFSPVKINTVMLQGINDDEIIDFVRFAIEHNVIVRFIESFHTNRMNQQFQLSFVPEVFIRNTIEKVYGPLIPVSPVFGCGPATYVTLPHTSCVVGFISNNTRSFCAACNRLRLTHDGLLKSCLFSPQAVDLKKLLRGRAGLEEIRRTIMQVMQHKHHYRKDTAAMHDFYMSSIGG